MQGKPRLWLCGHIHEGRGVAVRQLDAQTTTVFNAAKANAGRAMQLDHDPVIVQVDNDDRLSSAASSNLVTIVSMGNGKHKADKVRASKDEQFVPKPEDSENHVLAIGRGYGSQIQAIAV
jgi:hypothetical protein